MKKKILVPLDNVSESKETNRKKKILVEIPEKEESPKEEKTVVETTTKKEPKKEYSGSELYYEKYYNPNPWQWEDGKPRRHNFTQEQIDECYKKCTSSLDANKNLPYEKYTPGYSYSEVNKEWLYYNGLYVSVENSFEPKGKFYSVPVYPIKPSLQMFRKLVYDNQFMALNKVTEEQFNDDDTMKDLLELAYNAKVERYKTLLYYLSEMVDMTTGLSRHESEEKDKRYQKLVEEYNKKKNKMPKYVEKDESPATNLFGGLLNRIAREEGEELINPQEPIEQHHQNRRIFTSGYNPDFERRDSRMDYENRFRQGLRDAADGRIPLDDDPFEYYNNDYRPNYSRYSYNDLRRGKERFYRSILKSQGLTDKEIYEKTNPKPPMYKDFYDTKEDDEEFKPSKLSMTINGKKYDFTICEPNIPRYMYDYKLNYRRSIAPKREDVPVWRSPSEIAALKRTEKFRDMSAEEFYGNFYKYVEAVEMGERSKQNTTRIVNSYDHKNYKRCMVGMSNKFPYSVNSGLEHLEIAMKTDQVAKLLDRERIIRQYDLTNPKVIKDMGTEVVTLNKSWIPYLRHEIPFNEAKWTIEDKEAYRIQRNLYEKGMDEEDIEALIKNGKFTITPEKKVEGFIRQHYSVDYYSKEDSEKILNSKEYKEYIRKLAEETGMSAKRIHDNSLKRRRFYEHVLRQNPDIKAKTYDKVYGEDLLQ